jgi:NAD(P)-dependent dehydrogenase (short-subunit alcohol dehydrogenase family)
VSADILSPLTEHHFKPIDASRPDRRSFHQPLGSMKEISDIVGAVMYLESAPFVTGEILHVDGRQSAGH